MQINVRALTEILFGATVASGICWHRKLLPSLGVSLFAPNITLILVQTHHQSLDHQEAKKIDLHVRSPFYFNTMIVHQYKKNHCELKSSFTYTVIYSFTILTRFDKRTQYMKNCIQLNTVSFC